MFTAKLKIVTIFLLFNCFCFAQDTGHDFFRLIENEKMPEAYALLEKEKIGGLSEETFTATWKNINLSVGKLVDYEKKCEEETDSGLVSYYNLTFEKSNIVFGVPLKNNKVQGFFVVQAAPCDSGYLVPEYISPGSYAEEMIKLEDGLEITVTQPKENASGMVCILLSGSGQHDKDATIGLNKPLKDLALGLASKGIPSVRFPKTTLKGNYTVEDEYISDVDQVLSFLKQSEKYRNARIFLVGHSLGGMLAPTIAANREQIKGAVMIGANFRPIEDLLIEQTTYVLSLDKQTPEEHKNQYIQTLEAQIAYLKHSLNDNAETAMLPFGVPASYWLSLSKFNLDNPKNRKNLKKPTLILWGEKDYQVTKKDYDLLGKNFRGKKYTFISYPDLNHILTKSDGSLGPSEYNVQRNIPEYVITDIVAWTKSIKK